MSEWKKVRLGEVCTIKYGKNQKDVVSDNGNIPIYGTGGLMAYATKSLYNKPSVLIGRKGTIDKIRYVEHPFWTVDTLFYTEINDKIVVPRFLYYALCLIDFIQYNEGTTIPSLRTEALNRILISLPPLPIQRKIAKILSVFDRKIELNNKINKTLEELAKTVWKRCTEGECKEVKLSDVADFIGGYSYNSDELVESTTAMATIKSFDRKGGFKLDGYKEIMPSKVKKEQYADIFDILVAHTDLTQNAEIIGNAEMIMNKSGYEDIIFSMDLIKVVPKSNISNFLIIQVLKDYRFKSHCLGYVNGTTVLHLSKKALNEYIFPFPSDTNAVDRILASVYKQIALNTKETSYLSSLRDTLLPKLLNNQIKL